VFDLKFPSVVSDVMKYIISIEADAFVSEAAQKMIETKIGSIIITENGEPKGIITRSVMIKRVIVAHNDPRENTAGSVMSMPLISIDACTPILDVMRYIRDHDINQVLLSEDSKYVGIVSEGDLVRAVTLCSLTQFSSLLRIP
jgi:signal-transduction protein with cAMP-binding, CBS, and nucleotidyltransferase domain